MANPSQVVTRTGNVTGMDVGLTQLEQWQLTNSRGTFPEEKKTVQAKKVKKPQKKKTAKPADPEKAVTNTPPPAKTPPSPPADKTMQPADVQVVQPAPAPPVQKQPPPQSAPEAKPPVCAKQKLDYVTAAQAQLYISGILVDECYDVQYTYREFKEPIYGYNSKHYDAILPGTVIIHGQFTINYKHDSYLMTIFNKINAEASLSSITGGASAAHSPRRAMEMQAEADRQARGYKAALLELNNLRKELEEKKKKYDTEKLRNFALKSATESMGSSKQVLEAKYDQEIAAKEKALNDFMGNVYVEDVNSDGTKDPETNPESKTYKIKKALAEYDTQEQGLQGLMRANEKEVANEQQKLDQMVNDLEALRKKEQELVDLVSVNSIRLTDGSVADQQTMAGIQMDLSKVGEKILALERKIPLQRQTVLNAAKDSISSQTQQINQMEAKVADSGWWLWKDTSKKDALKLKKELLLAKMQKIKELDAFDNMVKEQGDQLKSNQTSFDALEKEVGKDKKGGTLADAIKAATEKLKGLKANLMDTAEEMALANEKKIADNRGAHIEKRAEDHSVFELFLFYNGEVHKIIDGCSLTGHSHVIMQSGEPVKEYYTFIARSIR